MSIESSFSRTPSSQFVENLGGTLSLILWVRSSNGPSSPCSAFASGLDLCFSLSDLSFLLPLSLLLCLRSLCLDELASALADMISGWME